LLQSLLTLEKVEDQFRRGKAEEQCNYTKLYFKDLHLFLNIFLEEKAIQGIEERIQPYKIKYLNAKRL